MSEHQFSILWMALLVLGMVYLSIGYRLSYLKAHYRMVLHRKDEGWAGKFIEWEHKPRTTIHTIVNNIFALGKR